MELPLRRRYQGVNGKDDEWFAWAVRPGDVAAQVPEPGTLLLAAAGLIGVAGRRSPAERSSFSTAC